jgi:hypothetical protein
MLPQNQRSSLLLGVGVIGAIGAGVAVYAILAFVSGSPELGRLVRALRRK